MSDDLANGADAMPSEFLVVLDDETHRVAYQAGKTLLDCVIDAGLDPPFLCQQGQCGSCMSVLRQGEVRMLLNQALSIRDIDAGYVLACQSVPVGLGLIELDMDS